MYDLFDFIAVKIVMKTSCYFCNSPVIVYLLLLTVRKEWIIEASLHYPLWPVKSSRVLESLQTLLKIAAENSQKFLQNRKGHLDNWI